MTVAGPADLDTLGATGALRLLEAGDISSEELLDAQLDRVERHNGDLNLVVALDERARARRSARSTACR